MSKKSHRRPTPPKDPEFERRRLAFITRPAPDLWSDEEIADEVLLRLSDFSPSLTVGAAEDLDLDQVEVNIIMCRKPEPDFLDELVAEGELESPGFAHRVEVRVEARQARSRANRRRRRSSSK